MATTLIHRSFVISILLLCLAAFASADDFNFTYAGFRGNTASGTLLTTALGGDQFEITAILNGLVNGNAISSLLPAGGYLGNDNLLFVPPAPGYLDVNGLSFMDASGNDFNLYYTGNYDLLGSNGVDDFGSFTVTPAGPPAVPEPDSILLLGTGFFGMAGFVRRKFRL